MGDGGASYEHWLLDTTQKGHSLHESASYNLDTKAFAFRD